MSDKRIKEPKSMMDELDEILSYHEVDATEDFRMALFEWSEACYTRGSQMQRKLMRIRFGLATAEDH